MEYGAIDLHAKESEIRIVDASGGVVLARRVATTRARLSEVFGGRPRLRVLVESGTGSEWVAQHLEAVGHEVVVADPNYRLMYGARPQGLKTDRRDVAALAEANRCGIYRAVHRVSAVHRDRRRRLQVRAQMVAMRTQVINVTRAVVRSEGRRVRPGASHTFRQRLEASELPPSVYAALTPLLDVLDRLTTLIGQSDAWTQETAAADPVARQLMTVPGVGPVVALAFQATLDTPHRFRAAAGVAAYLGLIPREDSSGERRRRGGLTKRGPTQMRTLLVQSAWYLWRSPRGSAALHAWARRLSDRRGRRIAVVAVARRLARMLWAIWRDGRAFDPTRVGRLAAAA